MMNQNSVAYATTANQNTTTKPYEITTQFWDELKVEIDKLLPLIQNDSTKLTPDSVKEVRRLVKLAQDAPKAYNRALNESYKTYKLQVDQKLHSLGYTIIDNYIKRRREEDTRVISERLNEKMSRYNTIIHELIASTSMLTQTKFASAISGAMLALYPNVNSGSLSKDVKNWDVLMSSAKTIIDFADSKITPIMCQVPAGSATAFLFTQFFTTGDRTLLTDESIRETLEKDIEWLRSKVIADKLTSEEKLLQMIAETAKENTNESLNQIKKLIQIWDTRHLYK